MSLRERSIMILDALAREHGPETFVSDGYAYYEDALGALIAFAREIRNEALEEAAHAIVCTPKYPLSDHDAHERALDRVLALKDNVGQFTSSAQSLKETES